MAGLVLACKAAIAVLLAAAGGAKLADLPEFAATVRLFLPAAVLRRRPWLPRAGALSIAAGEVAAGAVSLSSPQVGWLNLAILVLCCAFVAVSVAGYLRHPGRACRCFGALSGRSFGPAGIGRSILLAAAAAVAAAPVSSSLIRIGPAGRLGLLAGALLVAWAALSAAAAVGAGRDAQPEWAR